MSISKKLLGTLALVAGIVFLADTAAAQQDNLIDTIKKRGKIQVGFGSFLPWAIRDKQGNWVGFEIDVLDQENDLFQAQVDLVQARRDQIVASYRLKAAVGELTVVGIDLPVEPYDPEAYYLDVRDRLFGLGESLNAD